MQVVLFELLPLRVLPPFFFAIFSYWMIGLHPGCVACVLWFAWLLVAGNVSATTLCMTIGAASPSNAVANLVRWGALLVWQGSFSMTLQAVACQCQQMPCLPS
jgi:hypothetical protein